jgi:hypothetical protein
LHGTSHGGALFVVQLAVAVFIKTLQHLFHSLGIAWPALAARAISVLRQCWACDQQCQRGDG